MRLHNLDYNTQRGEIQLKEYGRTVQDMAKQVVGIKDEDERLEKAQSVVKLMKILNPGLKDNHENEQMMWDHLHIMTNFQLDVEKSGFEKPSPETVSKKPNRVEYPAQNIKLKHYGKNIEKIINKLTVEEDSEKQLAGISKVGKMMKKFYAEFNSDMLEDDVVSSQIEEISGRKLKVDRERIQADDLFYVSKAEIFSDIQNFKKKHQKPGGNNIQNNNHNNNRKQKKRK